MTHMSTEFIFLLLLTVTHSFSNGSASEGRTRYFLYTVNSGEGFNLRRDVHLRAATIVKELLKKDDWVLVLPPWPHLYHWKSGFSQYGIKWERFFELESLNEYVPSIEYEDYLAKEGHVIDKAIHLQYFAEGWGDEGFKEKYEQRPCIEAPRYERTKEGAWQGGVFLGSGMVEMRSFQCVSVLGFTKTLLPLIESSRKKEPPRSVLMERLETVMHSDYGGIEYWAARYSMVYSEELRRTGNQFMRSRLNYDPGSGNGRQAPKDGGRHFLSVHLRRKDYIHAHPDKVPSLRNAAKQINTLKKENQLDWVFLSSDAPPNEKKELKGLVSNLVWYQPTDDELHHHGDGGVAIIDQWIAAHAKYFVGTSESTFSFRVREDRQLMKFSIENTFNQLCGGGDPHDCDKPSVWKIHDEVWSLFMHNSQHHLEDEL